MSAAEMPMPPELAVSEQPISDDDLALFFVIGHTDAEAIESPDDYRDEYVRAARVERFAIVADDQAEWALRKLSLANAELRRLREQRDEWVARIDGWLVSEGARHRRTAEYMNERLEDYALRVREAGGPATIELPAGTIKTTASQPVVVIDDDDTVALLLDTVLTEPLDGKSDDDRAAYEAWRKAFAALLTDGEPPQLVKREPKVYAGPLRKLVRVAELPAGNEMTVRYGRCDHEVTMTVAGDITDLPERGEMLPCPSCPSDPITGEKPQQPVAEATLRVVTRLAAVGPDGAEVPGCSVRAGGITPKVEAR